MKKRIITAIAILAVLVPAVYFGGIFFLIIGLFLSVVASYEMMSMFCKKSKALENFRYIVPIFSGIVVLFIYFSVTKGLNQVFDERIISSDDIIPALLYHFWVNVTFVSAIIICLGGLIFTKDSTAHDIMACITTLTYCGLIMGYVISIEYIQPLGRSEVLVNQLWGGRSFAYLLTIVAVTDTAAYFIGTKFGKNKLCPSISPKKSVEGAIGGLVFGGVFGVIAALTFQMIKFADDATVIGVIITLVGILIISVILSATVQIGDLVASKIKRSYEIKDFGNIFPGHGGVLDRFDSLIFAGAVYYLIVQFVQLVVLGAS